jgi:hypothetical protein
MKLLTVVFFLFPLSVHANCSHEDAPYELKRMDPAYQEAMKLKEKLDRQGFGVTCVLPSKSIRIFDGQLGAAFYRTAVGNIDVMFMPQSTDFWVRVVENKQNGRFLYTFNGKPHALIPVWDASRPFHFIQHRNYMFVTTDDKLAEKLRAAVPTRTPVGLQFPSIARNN